MNFSVDNRDIIFIFENVKNYYLCRYKKDLGVNLEIIGFVILIVYVSNILYVICVYV